MSRARESRPELAFGAASKSFGGDTPMIADPDPRALDLRRDVEQDRALWQDGYRAGLDQGRTEMSCPHVHPHISASAERMFSGWDGAEAAHRRSVERFRQQQGVRT